MPEFRSASASGSVSDPVATTPIEPSRSSAAQVIAVQRVLARDNRRHLSGGETAAQRYPRARAAAGHAFTMLSTGLPTHYH